MIKHIIVLPDGTEITSGAKTKNTVMAVKCTESVNVGNELTIGSAFANILEATLLTPDGVTLKAGDEVTVYKVYDGGNRTSYGVFVLEKPTQALSNTVKLTGYDRIVKLDKDLTEWVRGLAGWPYTLTQFAEMVCNACGVEFEMTEVPNGDFPVYRFSQSGVTGRQIMRWLGEICCRFCRATPEGKIAFGWYKPASRDITPAGTNYYFSGSLSYEDYSVTPVDHVLIRRPEAEGGDLWPNIQGENPYIITGNPIITRRVNSTLRTYLGVIEQELSAIAYTPCKVSIPASLDIRAGDVVEITDSKGKSILCAVMTKTTSGQRDTLECTGSYRRDSAGAVNNRSVSEIAQEKASIAEKNAISAAESVAQSVLDSQTQMDIFNKLTDNGAIQGIYAEDGKWYINAELAQIINLFTQNIFMSGMFIGSGQAFLEPGFPELEELKRIIMGSSYGSLADWDFNDDGKINLLDYQLCYEAVVGSSSLSGWSGARESEVTVSINPSDPQSAISISGRNVWGRNVQISLGANSVFNGPDIEQGFNLMLSQSQAFWELEARVAALENK